MRHLCWIALVILMAACTPTETVVLPTATPLPTPTPSVENVGTPNNPLQWVIQPAMPDLAAQAEMALEAAILRLTNVSVDVVLTDDTSASLAALCQADSPLLAAVTVDGLGYLAATGRNCGTASFRVRRGNQTGEAAVLVFNRTLGVTDLTALNGRAFCRVSYADVFSWLLPSMVFRAQSVDTAEFASITDYPDYDRLLSAVANGTCTAASLPESVYDLAVRSDSVEAARVAVAGRTVRLPYGVIIYPALLPQAARISLTDGLERLNTQRLVLGESPESTPEATSEAEATREPQPNNTPRLLLEPFFGENASLIPTTDSDYAELRAFVQAARLDFSQLGN